MIDRFFIGQFNHAEAHIFRSNLLWTLTIGQFSADQNFTVIGRLTGKKKRKPSLRILNNFCQPPFGTFAKPHNPTHNPIFAKEPNFPSRTLGNIFCNICFKI